MQTLKKAGADSYLRARLASGRLMNGSGICRSFPLPPALLAAAAAAHAHAVLHDLEAFAEPLIVNHLPLAQERQRRKKLFILRHVHQMLIRHARLLLGCNTIQTTGSDEQDAAA